MSAPAIYTVGHSSHPIGYFLRLLTTHRINCIVDVRSVAASRYNPQYNKNELALFLKQNRIAYLHFAEEFGARQTDKKMLDENGRVDFEKVRDSEKFRSGIQRLQQGISKGFTIALMCAEADPIECHRFGMVTPALVEEGMEVIHILKNNTALRNNKLEEQLLKKYEKEVATLDIFGADRLKAAYSLLNREIGFAGK